MRVYVDPAGCHEQAVGVELARAALRNGPHLGDATVSHGHIGIASFAARAVDHGSAADHEVVHGLSSGASERAVPGQQGSDEEVREAYAWIALLAESRSGRSRRTGPTGSTGRIG